MLLLNEYWILQPQFYNESFKYKAFITIYTANYVREHPDLFKILNKKLLNQAQS